MVNNDRNKSFYSEYHDKIFEKRVESPYPARRAVHKEIYESVLENLSPGDIVLDAGCGEGALSILMAEKGCIVTGIDLSLANVQSAKDRVKDREDLAGRIKFEVADCEAIPFADDSYDFVVSNHVLEHLPSFEKGLAEVLRVARTEAIIGIPTCLNPAAWMLLGRSNYWQFNLRSPLSFVLGFLRVLFALVTFREGVDEGYGGSTDRQIHVFRFPWVLIGLAKKHKSKLIEFRAQSIAIPFSGLTLTGYAGSPFFRYSGIGTVYRYRPDSGDEASQS